MTVTFLICSVISFVNCADAESLSSPSKETENYGVADGKQDFFQPAGLNEDATLSLIRINISSKSQVTVVKFH